MTKKPLCCNQPERLKERFETPKTPAPASTLVFSHSLLPSVPVANRGQVFKETSSIQDEEMHDRVQAFHFVFQSVMSNLWAIVARWVALGVAV